jgi:hypothetical protein
MAAMAVPAAAAGLEAHRPITQMVGVMEATDSRRTAQGTERARAAPQRNSEKKAAYCMLAGALAAQVITTLMSKARAALVAVETLVTEETALLAA